MQWIRLGAVLAALVAGPACAGGGHPSAAARSSAGAPVVAAAPANQAPPDAAAAPAPSAAPAGTPPVKVGAAAVPPPTTRATAVPAPPPPAAVVDARPAGTATASGAGTTVVLRVPPTEQYRGEMFHATVEVTGPTAIRSVKLDQGNGTVVDADPAPGWSCPSGSRRVVAGPPAHSYAKAGRYTVTALVTVVPCVFVPGQTGAGTPWVASGPDKVIQVRMGLTQRADPPPPS